MKKMAFILLTMFFSIVFTRGEECAMQHRGTQMPSIPCSIQDKDRLDIVVLSDILNGCRFELPQGANIYVPRCDEQFQSRRPNCSSKTIETFASVLSQQRHSHLSESNHKAVAASRHSRGYYIYALRHIII